MGCGSSKQQGLDANRPAHPFTNTTAPPQGTPAAQQSAVQQPPPGGKKRKLGTNLGLLSTLVKAIITLHRCIHVKIDCDMRALMR